MQSVSPKDAFDTGYWIWVWVWVWQIYRQLHVARLLMKLCIQSSGTMGKVNKIDVAYTKAFASDAKTELSQSEGEKWLANELDDKMEIV